MTSINLCELRGIAWMKDIKRSHNYLRAVLLAGERRAVLLAGERDIIPICIPIANQRRLRLGKAFLACVDWVAVLVQDHDIPHDDRPSGEVIIAIWCVPKPVV